MKVVINDCFGGFGLSNEAEALYAKKKGFELFRYKQIHYKHDGGENEYVKIPHGQGGLTSYTFTKDYGDKCHKFDWKEGGGYWHGRDINQLLTDIRCEVSYTHVATMPIPLYERIKEALQELYAENQDLKADKWQTMESAPKDEDISFLIYIQHKTDENHSIAQVSWFEGRLYPDAKEYLIDWEDGINLERIKAWRPLPAPPEAALRSKEE